MGHTRKISDTNPDIQIALDTFMQIQWSRAAGQHNLYTKWATMSSRIITESIKNGFYFGIHLLLLNRRLGCKRSLGLSNALSLL